MLRVTPMGAAMQALLGDGPDAAQALMARFAARRLGPVAESWLGDGPARPVTPRMLLRVLGWREADRLAALAGLPTGEFLGRLVRLLPDAMRRQLTEAATDPASLPPRQPADGGTGGRPAVWFRSIA